MRALSFENNQLKLSEPFDGLFTQGMVCHETYKDPDNNWINPEDIETVNGKKCLKKDNSKIIKVGPSESMSKSKKNTIDPENIISSYGADSARLFILSDSPPEKDVQWSEEGITSSYKFIQKLWNLNLIFIDEIKKNNPKDDDEELTRETNKFLKKITENLENFSYNKIIANLHEIYGLLIKQIKKKYKKATLIENYEKILIAIMPVIPHFSSECLSLMGSKRINWPAYDASMLKEEKINIVVQVNGKKRDVINTKPGLSEEDLFELINKSETLNKYLYKQKIKRKIYIKDKLINIII